MALELAGERSARRELTAEPETERTTRLVLAFGSAARAAVGPSPLLNCTLTCGFTRFLHVFCRFAQTSYRTRYGSHCLERASRPRKSKTGPLQPTPAVSYKRGAWSMEPRFQPSRKTNGGKLSVRSAQLVLLALYAAGGRVS